MTTGYAARRLTPWGGLLLLAAVLSGLFAMHGLQPSPGPIIVPHVLEMPMGHPDAGHPPMSLPQRHDDGHGSPQHNGHPGGQVCLALLMVGAVLLLLLAVTTTGRSVPLPVRLLLRVLPRGPTARPRGPTLTELCVIRV